MQDNKLFNVSVVLIMVILALRDLASFTINPYLLFVIMSIPFLFLNTKQCIVYTCFLFPMMGGVTPYYMGVGLVALCIRLRESLKLVQLVPFVMIVLIELFHWLYTPTTHRIPELLSYFAVVGLFFILPFLDDDSFDIKKSIRWFIYGISFEFLLLILRSYFLYGDFSGLLETRDVFSIEEGSVSQFFQESSNTIALYSITVVSILLLGKNKIDMNPVLLCILLILSLFAGACSISRTWLIDLVFLLVLFAFSQKRKFPIYLAILVFIVSIWFSYYADSEITILFQSRFASDNVSTAGERTDIFAYYNDMMFSNSQYLPFGVGAFELSTIFNNNVPHNAIQHIFVCYGVAGLFVFGVFAYIFGKKVDSFHIPFVYHIPFATVFLFLQSSQFCMPYKNMTPLIFALLYLKLYKMTIEKSNVSNE